MHFFYLKGSRTPLLSLTRRMHLLNFLRGGFIPEGGAVALIQFSPIELQLYRGTMFSVVRRPLERERWARLWDRSSSIEMGLLSSLKLPGFKRF